MSDTEDVCKICGGKRADHFDAEGKQKSVHVFTTREGDLLTADQQKKRDQQGQAGARVPFNPAMLAGGLNQQGFSRLVELLVDKKAISQEEALYIAGFGPKPSTGQFADPARRL